MKFREWVPGRKPPTSPVEKPNRLVEGSRVLMERLFTSDVTGQEQLAEIPPDARVIIVTSHFSDYDVPLIIAALGDTFKRQQVVAEENHFRASGNLGALIGHAVTGNAHPVDYTRHPKKGEARRGSFNPDNFIPLQAALEAGDQVTMAAYYDPKNAGDTFQLPNRAGNGAAYLAAATENVILVPVVVEVDLPKPQSGGQWSNVELARTRPPAHVRIGKPFQLEPISGVGHLAAPDRDNLAGFSAAKKELQAHSEQVMQSLAALLPPEKRGGWDTK